MALNNVRRDSWFLCKTRDNKKAEHISPRGWNKSIRKRKAQLRDARAALALLELIQ